MINRLYVFANMGKLDKLPKSGGQSSARRVMEGFKSEGIEIIPIRRHRAELQTKLGHVLEVGYFAFYDLLKMIAKMIFRRRKNAAFMQMTYAGALVPYELILTSVARIMGFKSVEYLQGGLVMDTFPKKGKLHRWMFCKNIEMQEYVCFEGVDALKLTEGVVKNTHLEHFPSYDFLVEMMQKQHFYLFPTQEKAEGHSNALNEAMSQGVIPIACDYHFNKSVIGEDFLVVKGYEPIDYVKAIEYVLDHVDMEAQSKKLWKRVKDLYSYSKVNKSVCQQLKML